MILFLQLKLTCQRSKTLTALKIRLYPLNPYFCRNHRFFMNKQTDRKLKKDKISRKQFLRLAGLVLLIPLFRIWQVTVNKKKEETAAQPHEIAVQQDLPDGVHFFGNVILVKSGEKIGLLSSKCTHLGCQINKAEKDRLICPCHGSEYGLDGKPLKGPAINSLTKIDFATVNTNQETVLRF